MKFAKVQFIRRLSVYRDSLPNPVSTSRKNEASLQRGETYLSIVVPVYNQEKRVSDALVHLRSVLDALPLSYELIVVNDGSVDNTLDALKKVQDVDSRIKVISYKQNKGKGYAVKKGVLESKGDIVMFIDGDLDVSPTLIGEYVGQLQDSDLVIASKMHPLSIVKSPASRKFLSKAFNFVVRLIVGIKAKDTQAGMKAGRGEALRQIFELIVVKRYAFDVELLAVASLLGLRIREMPVEINIERNFKMNDIFRMFVDVLGIGYRLHISRWYQRASVDRNVLPNSTSNHLL